MDLEQVFGLRPFTRAQARSALGLSARRWRTLAPQLVRLGHGVYCLRWHPRDWGRYAQRISAALITRTDHLAVGISAACLLGLPNPTFTSWARLPVTIGGRQTRSARAISRCLAAPIPTSWGPSTDLIDTAVTVAAELPLPQALIVTDAVARRLAGSTDRFELASRHCRDEVRRRLRLPAEAPALALADPAAESPAESFFRGHMILGGFPEPRCGVPLLGASGRQYFADMVLDGLIIEVDGALKYRAVEDLLTEKRREDDLRAAGHGFHRVLATDLFEDPAAEMSRLTFARSRLALPA